MQLLPKYPKVLNVPKFVPGLAFSASKTFQKAIFCSQMTAPTLTPPLRSSVITGYLTSTPAVSLSFTYLGGGNYTATLNPVASGVFQMHVLVNGAELRECFSPKSSFGTQLVMG